MGQWFEENGKKGGKRKPTYIWLKWVADLLTSLRKLFEQIIKSNNSRYGSLFSFTKSANNSKVASRAVIMFQFGPCLVIFVFLFIDQPSEVGSNKMLLTLKFVCFCWRFLWLTYVSFLKRMEVKAQGPRKLNTSDVTPYASLHFFVQFYPQFEDLISALSDIKQKVQA